MGKWGRGNWNMAVIFYFFVDGWSLVHPFLYVQVGGKHKIFIPDWEVAGEL